METTYALIRTEDPAKGYEIGSEPYKLQWLAHHSVAREVLVQVQVLREDGLDKFLADYPSANLKTDSTIPLSWENKWELLSYPSDIRALPRQVDVMEIFESKKQQEDTTHDRMVNEDIKERRTV